MSPTARKPKTKPVVEDEPIAVTLEPETTPMSAVACALQAARNAFDNGDITACHAAVLVALQEVRKLQ